ncbi:MAG: DUF1761 domain-containing protein [Pseudomonadota bacterium]
MAFAGINHLAVVLAAAASFIFGGIWYGVLSSAWMEAAGVRPEDMKRPDGSPVFAPYITTFVALLVMAYMLAGIIGHLGMGQVTLRNGLISAGFIWGGFVLTALVVNHAFQGRSKTLTLIDGGHWLGVLLVQGAVIGLMSV